MVTMMYVVDDVTLWCKATDFFPTDIAPKPYSR